MFFSFACDADRCDQKSFMLRFMVGAWWQTAATTASVHFLFHTCTYSIMMMCLHTDTFKRKVHWISTWMIVIWYDNHLYKYMKRSDEKRLWRMKNIVAKQYFRGQVVANAIDVPWRAQYNIDSNHIRTCHPFIRLAFSFM